MGSSLIPVAPFIIWQIFLIHLTSGMLNIMLLAMPWLGQLAGGLSPWMALSYPKPVHVGFVVGKWSWEVCISPPPLVFYHQCFALIFHSSTTDAV